MNPHVNAIAGRLSLRPPQRRSLEILDRITEIVPPKKGADLAAALAAILSEFPTVTDFEREFPSLCFALATGVGKTRLMGAFISYLHLAHGINNFFVMAPNARTLIEQSIGRGLRLPYGKRTGVNSVDRLNIIAHDKFQEIVDEAKKPDSAIRLQQVILEPEQLGEKTVTVVSQSRLDSMLGIQPARTPSTQVAGSDEPRAFQTPEDEKVAPIRSEVIRKRSEERRVGK